MAAGRIGELLRGAFVDNIALKFVAFVLALTVFILVHSDEDSTVSVYVKLSFKGTENRVMVSEPVHQVRVTVRGPWRKIKRLDPEDVELPPIDLSAFQRGQLSLTPDMFRVPPRVEIAQLQPSTITLELEPLVEKEVPVVPLTIGEPARGFGIAPPRPTPERVMIEGAESAVRLTTQVQTEDISLSGRREPFTTTAKLQPPRRHVSLKDVTEVDVAITLVEEQRTRELAEVPVVVRMAPGAGRDTASRFAPNPGVVRVVLRGPELALERVVDADVRAIVEVHADDQDARRARIVVEGVPEGVAFEVAPRAVMLEPRL